MTQTGTTVTRPNPTDVGNGQRFALQHRGWAHYCYAWRTWLIWSGQHWQRDAGDRAMQMAKATAAGLFVELASVTPDEARRHLAKWAMASQSEPRLRAMLTLAQSEPGIPVTPEELDTDPMLLGCENGTLELRTGTLRPARREDSSPSASPSSSTRQQRARPSTPSSAASSPAMPGSSTSCSGQWATA